MTARRATAKLSKTLPRRAKGVTERGSTGAASQRVLQGNLRQKLKDLKGRVTLDIDLGSSRERRR